MRDPLGIVGTTIDRRYAVRRFVAEGGFGIVYQAEALALGVKVAIKVLRSDVVAASREARARFEQEARVLAKLRHPGIVSITDASHLDDGTPYLALEWIDGETLDTYINRLGALPLDDALSLLGPVARALTHAHELQIIHRDIKPSNMMIVGGSAKVLDFGLARWASPQGMRTTTESGTGLSIGFAAPEQYGKEFGPVDARADQFALAAVVYAALTAKPPFAGESLTEVMWATCMAPARPTLREARPDLSPAIDDVLQRALAIRAEGRYGSIQQFWSALEEAARNGEIAPATFKQGPPTQTAGALPQAATLPSPVYSDAPATKVEGSFVVAPTMPAATGPAGTKPTGAGGPPPPPSEPPSVAPSTRASSTTRWTIIIALGAAIGGGAFAVWPLLFPSKPPAVPPKPSASVSSKPSASASAVVTVCGVMDEGEVCVPGGKLHRGPPDCNAVVDPPHKAACPDTYADVATFILDKYEVSYERYAKCKKCKKHEGEAKLPVVNVSRAEAAAFCAFEKRRLPSDSEWELAAAGLASNKYPWGNKDPKPELAVYGVAAPVAVDKGAPEVIGTLHLGGNVAEWTSSDAPEDAPVSGVAMEFMKRAWVRGGSYASDEGPLRSWSREAYAYEAGDPKTEQRYPHIGFRCAKKP